MMLEYKRTAAGVIPTEWEARTLDSIGSFSKGQGIRRNEASSGALPCIRYGEIYTHHHDILRNYNSYISSAVALKSTRLAYGDILFAGSGETKEEIGKAIAYVGNDEAYAGGDIIILSPRAQCPEFLGYVLNSPMVVRQKASKGQGDAVVHIGARALGTVVIPLPPLGEQRAIATALSDADALIAGLNRLIAKKRDIKQAAMQQFLTGQTRLPGVRGEWTTAELGDVAAIRNNKVIASSAPSGTRCVELESIDQATGQLLGSFEAAGATPKYTFKAGDVLFGRLRAYLRKYWLASFDGVCSTEIWPLIPRDNRLVGAFLHLLVQTEEFVDAAAISYGTHMPRSDWSVLKRLVFRLPTPEEQTAIATVVSDMDAELSALEARLTKTRAIKQGMMQELLTGRTRLV